MGAYISNDLNMVKELDPQRHELALLQEAFLSKGGTIEVLPFWVDHETQGVSRTMTPNFQSSGVKEETDLQAARIREMAKTMNQGEICEAEGLRRGVLRGIGKRYNIEFTVGIKNPIAPNKLTLEAEALMVIRIKDCIAKDINRAQCARALAISTTLLSRLIGDYDIDYPKMKPAFRKNTTRSHDET
jgi:hypothetical protein